MPTNTQCLGNFALCSTLGLTLLLPACGSVDPGGSSSQAGNTVELQLLAINDFHGNLEPPLSDGTAAGGGVARLATLIKQRAAERTHSIVVGAGDLVGASPLLSASFHDEPTIAGLSLLGLELSAVGNHEFDEGLAELQRLQQGGCHPQGCTDPMPFTGAAFQYLAANVIDESTGQPIFPGSAIREFDGIRVGFIGITLEATPTLLIPSMRAGLRFLDEVETVNRAVDALRADGVEALVVLIHEGGTVTEAASGCASLEGPITDIVRRFHAEVDLVISGHTHRTYNCIVDNRLLTSAGAYGMELSEIILTLDRRTLDVVEARAETLAVGNALAEDPGMAALMARYQGRIAPLMQRQVASVSAPISRERNPAGESPMGAVIADAMLAAAKGSTGEAIDVAFMNPGGVRGDIAAAGPVTFADLFTVQPFGNTLTVLTLRGADIEAVLRQQFTNEPRRILQVSEGFSYRWREGADAQVVTGSIRIHGEALQADRLYRVVTNNFVAEGGDGFTAFAAGTDPTPAGVDVEALEAWLGARANFAPPAPGRITLSSGN